MAPSRIRPDGLRIDIPSHIHNKYLGEFNDLHFIPSSPLIERQKFTAEEEVEITRLCTLLLADIPHSDDTNDGSVGLLVARMQPEAGAHLNNKLSKAAAAILDAKLAAAGAAPANKATTVDSATPSESSRRDTFTASDYCTPMTSAGITPGETNQRFSDAFKRAGSNKSSNLRKQTSNSRKSVIGSVRGFRSQPDFSSPKSSEESYPFPDIDSTNWSLRLVHDMTRTSETHLHTPCTPSLKHGSNFDFNRSFPFTPSNPTSEDTNTRPISRIFDTIKKKRSLVDMKQNLEDATSSLLKRTNTKRQQGSLYHGPSTLAQQSRPAEVDRIEVPEPKRRFRLRFFGWRSKPTEVCVN